MYIPEHFAAPDTAAARALIEAHSFGMLLVPRASRAPEIAHVPFLLDADPAPLGSLRAHVAKANPVSAMLAEDLPVVAVFTGPHAYVSPSWYESPRTSVPTWNFTAVHAHGVARRIDDRDEVRRALADLTREHEGDRPDAWSVGGADPTYVERLLGAIVAFTIRIERFETKMKLSQNRSAGDRSGVVAGLRDRRGPNDEAIAALIDTSDRSPA